MPKKLDLAKKPESGPKELVTKETGAGGAVRERSPRKLVLPPDWKLPEVFRSRLGHSYGRQRTMVEEGQVLLILHEVPKPGDPNRYGQLFWRDALGRWSTTASGEGLAGLERLLNDYQEAIDKLARRLDRATLSQDYFAALKSIHPVERAIRNCHRVLQDARDGLRSATELIPLRDRAYELARRAELLREDARATLDYQVVAQTAEQSELNRRLNRTTARLNVLIALFFPLTAISTVFGMNMAHGFEGLSIFAFWAIVGGSLILGAIIAMLLNK